MDEQQKVNEKYKVDDVIAAIKGSAGIKATIQRKLGCSRATVDNYLKRYATAQAAYDEEKEVMGYVAESVVISAIRNKDVSAAQWYLVKKHRDRGYGDKSQVEAEIKIRNASDLTDEELANIASRSSGRTAET